MEQLRNIKVIQNTPFKVNEIIDITDTLPSRKNDPEPRRNPADITFISVHHSGVENGTIQGYADYHVNTRKWYHIGYHMVVKGNQLYQTNDLLTFSYHTSGNNNYTVGISVSGDFTKRSLTDDERKNLYAGILTLMSLFNIPVEHVLGHNQYPGNEKTECPGFSMDVVRDDIRKLQLQMKAVADPSQIKSNTYLATQQHTYLYNLYNSDPAYKWLEPNLLKLHEFMKENGMYFNQ